LGDAFVNIIADSRNDHKQLGRPFASASVGRPTAMTRRDSLTDALRRHDTSAKPVLANIGEIRPRFE
jgi:hypothetical protein